MEHITDGTAFALGTMRCFHIIAFASLSIAARDMGISVCSNDAIQNLGAASIHLVVQASKAAWQGKAMRKCLVEFTRCVLTFIIRRGSPAML